MPHDSSDHGCAHDERPALAIVTGMTPEAERVSRPLAYEIAEHAEAWLALAADEGEQAEAPFRVVVCSDIWWLNDEEARRGPVISVGPPDENALTAYLTDKLPSTLAVDGRLIVQMDLDLADLQACCWGEGEPNTRAAVSVFLERHLDEFLDAVAVRAGVRFAGE